MQGWNEIHAQLEKSLKKEVETMREILANMHQEELSLLINDRSTWAVVIEERSQLLARLNTFRDLRIAAIKQLEKQLYPNHLSQEIPLENLLPLDHENSCETLLLRDQMLSLIDRINLQSNRNEMLSHLSQQPQPLPEKKRKISIATLPEEELESENE